MRFQFGDLVEWTSQSMGIIKHKRGRVVAVVPAEAGARRIWDTLAVRGIKSIGTLATKHLGGIRDHESYLISVEQKTPRNVVKMRRLVYWPRVSLLKAVS